MASLCHPGFTTTKLSYRFPIFETSATALCGTTGMTLFIYIHLHSYIHIHTYTIYSYVTFWSSWEARRTSAAAPPGRSAPRPRDATSDDQRRPATTCDDPERRRRCGAPRSEGHGSWGAAKINEATGSNMEKWVGKWVST